MIVFKLIQVLPKKSRTFVAVITSEERILDLIASDKNHQGTELEAFKAYRVFYIDVLTGCVSSVSFFYSDLNHELSTLPLYRDLQDDSLGTETGPLAEDSLFIQITVNDKLCPFGEEDLRFSIDHQYKVDEEPLVEFTSRDSVSERQSIINGLANNQLNHYKKLLESEKKLREKFESISDEICQKLEAKVQNFHKRERDLLSELALCSQQIQSLMAGNSELKNQVKQLTQEKHQISESKDLLKSQLETLKKLDYESELQNYRDLLENMEQKWKDFSHNIQTSHETDPIHFLIREKEETIHSLQQQLQSLTRSQPDQQIESELRRRNLSFQKEKDQVYTIEGSKVVVLPDVKFLSIRTLGCLKSLEDFLSSPPSKRSNSSFRSDSKKLSRAPVLTSKSPVKYT
jgi:hypothetical protein